MISITEAINQVKSISKPLLKDTVLPIEKAGGYRMFKDVYSPMDMPPFRQSAMDGYALNLYDGVLYTIIGEIKAGDAHQPFLKHGEAVRIFTGAPVPDTANAVIMQEKTMANGSELIIEQQIPEHHNIRARGEQVKEGDLVLSKFTKLTPAAIGYLASLGISQIAVFKKPSIALLTTGSELLAPTQTLTYGKIYESNSKMLQNALYNLKFYDLHFYQVADDYQKTRDTLQACMSQHDLVIISGGISVGDYDFVGRALLELQVDEHFYTVKQKPGKPLYFGSKSDTLIFALPGNPAAALTCFYIYVYIALQTMMQNRDVELPRITAKSTNGFIRVGDRPQFLKAIYQEDKVTILEGQSSAMLQTFAIANALVLVPEDVSQITVDDRVDIILLPN